MIRSSICTLSVFTFISATATAQTSGYFLDRFPTSISGGTFSPTDITDSRIVAGNTTVTNGSVAYLIKGYTRPESTTVTLPGLGANHTPVEYTLTVNAVSEAGAAVGQGFNASSLPRAINWDATQTPWEL